MLSNKNVIRCNVMLCMQQAQTHSIFNAFEYILFMLSYVNGFTVSSGVDVESDR